MIRRNIGLFSANKLRPDIDHSQEDEWSKHREDSGDVRTARFMGLFVGEDRSAL